MDSMECVRTSTGFCVKVYPGIPTFDELREQFEEVHASYRGNPLKPIHAYEAVYRGLQSGPWQVELSYIHPNRPCSVDIALYEMRRLGLRPAFFEEALALFKYCPEELAKYPIMVLGSEKISQNKGRFLALFYEYEGKRTLFMDSMPTLQQDALYFTNECRFLAAKL